MRALQRCPRPRGARTRGLDTGDADTGDADTEDTDTDTSSSEDHECTIEDPDPDDHTATAIDWATDSAGNLTGELELRAPDQTAVSYTLEGWLNFTGLNTEWSQGPYEATAMETLTITIEVPSTAYMDSAQLDYLSDLSVHVNASHCDTGVVFERRSAPRLRVVWLESTSDPTLMTIDTAESAAPNGIYSDTIQAEIDRSLEEAGYVYEYGPSQ